MMGTDSAILLLLAEERARRAEAEAEVARLRQQLDEERATTDRST